MKTSRTIPWLVSLWLLAAAMPLTAQQKKPNILVIFGDDVGYFNISAYNLGMMGYKTPNIDRIAHEGALFTDYYAQQSCTAGRAAFITGQSPIRTGLLKVGLPGSKLGLQKEDPDDCRTAQAAGLHDLPERQEPSGRSQRVPAHGARLRRVLRQLLSPERRRRAGERGLSEEPHASARSLARAACSSAKPRPPTIPLRPIRALVRGASRPAKTPAR